MAVVAPFTTDDYLAAAARTFRLDVNAVREHDKPRASSLGSCARQQAYMMAGFTPDEHGLIEASARALDNEITAEQGRMFESLSVQIIENIPEKHLEIVGRQIELPPDYPVTGHPDGAMGSNGLITPQVDGLTWGWEHKHLGRYAYEKIIKVGLMKAEPVYVMQGGMYAHALGWDADLFTVISQDASAVRGDATANLRAKNPEVRWATVPGFNPKVNIIPMDMRPVKHGLVPMGINRALWLSDWKKHDGDPAHVAREADPTVVEEKWVADGNGGRMQVERAPFPCGWCPYLERCLAAGGGGNAAPALPWTESVEADD